MSRDIIIFLNLCRTAAHCLMFSRKTCFITVRQVINQYHQQGGDGVYRCQKGGNTGVVPHKCLYSSLVWQSRTIGCVYTGVERAV